MEAAEAELAATFSSDKVEEISIPKMSRLHFSYGTLVVVLNKLNGSVAVQRDCPHFVGYQRHGQAFLGVRVAFLAVQRSSVERRTKSKVSLCISYHGLKDSI